VNAYSRTCAQSPPQRRQPGRCGEAEYLPHRPRALAKVNEIMSTYFHQPYPARAAVGVASLPRNALVEADGVMFLQD